MNLQNLVDYCEEFGLPDPFSGASVPAPLNLDAVKSAIMIRCGLLTPLYGEPEVFTNTVTHWFFIKQWTFEHLINIIQAQYSPIENVFEDRTETSIFGSSNVHSGGWKDAASGKDTTTHSESDNTERTYTNYKDDTERTHTNYKETTKRSGSETTENQISAFNSSAYQPDNKSSTTYGENIGGSSDPREDELSITGSYKDSNTKTGSYKDTTTFGHKITQDNGKTITRTFQNDKEDHVGQDQLIMSRHGNVGTISADKLIQEELELLRHFDIYGFIAELFESDNMLMIY